jgi:inorganic pyrophosphatase
MKFNWDRKLKPNTKVKLITKKNRRFTSVPGIVISHKGGELLIKGKDGKEYVRNEPQRVSLPEMKVDLAKGDTVLSGKFKNKKNVVDDFSTDDNGQPTIVTDTGKELKLLAVRIEKLMKEEELSLKKIIPQEKSELEFPVKKTNWQGIPLEIENPTGTVRSGKDRNGKTWSIKMSNHYGRIPNTEGLDSDCIDIYLNAQNPKTNLVFKIHTKVPDTGEFDESKYMLGFKNQTEAEKAFRNSYDKPEFFGHIEEIPFETFKRRAMKDQLTEITSIKNLKDLIPLNETHTDLAVYLLEKLIRDMSGTGTVSTKEAINQLKTILNYLK